MTAPTRAKTAEAAARRRAARQAEREAAEAAETAAGRTRRRASATEATASAGTRRRTETAVERGAAITRRSGSTGDGARRRTGTTAEPGTRRRAEREAAAARIAERAAGRRTGTDTTRRGSGVRGTGESTGRGAAGTKDTRRGSAARKVDGTARASVGTKDTRRGSATREAVRRSTGARSRVAEPEARPRATATIEAPPRSKPARGEPERRATSISVQRAFARRAVREGRRPDPLERDEDRSAGRASFVILIIALLTVGVAATLWLSTQAIADSYRLEDAKKTAGELAERAAQLQRDVTKAESASALAERAKAMGMVPAGDPARLVVQPDGRVIVVGEPKPAEKPKPPKPATPPTETQQQPPPGTTPGAG